MRRYSKTAEGVANDDRWITVDDKRYGHRYIHLLQNN